MKTLPNEIILLDVIRSKDLSNELENLPDEANVVYNNNSIFIYF